jgi:hypothetical protein
MDDFTKCVDETVKNGRVSLKCKLGFWAVEAENSDSVYTEAVHYWQQYARDGEYSSIIGGESAVEKLPKFLDGLKPGDTPGI